MFFFFKSASGRYGAKKLFLVSITVHGFVKVLPIPLVSFRGHEGQD